MTGNNTIFKGEFALSNEEIYKKHFADKRGDREVSSTRSAGEADVESIDSESSDHLVTLSII